MEPATKEIFNIFRDHEIRIRKCKVCREFGPRPSSFYEYIWDDSPDCFCDKLANMTEKDENDYIDNYYKKLRKLES